MLYREHVLVNGTETEAETSRAHSQEKRKKKMISYTYKHRRKAKIHDVETHKAENQLNNLLAMLLYEENRSI